MVSDEAPRWAQIQGRLAELDELRERLCVLAAADGAGSGAAAALLERLDATMVRLEEAVTEYEAQRRELEAHLARLADAA
jgi:hypothetical protein